MNVGEFGAGRIPDDTELGCEEECSYNHLTPMFYDRLLWLR